MSRNCHPTEHQEARVLADWLRARGVFFIHICNEARRSFALARYLQAEGLTSGAPDYLILSHPKNEAQAEYDGVAPPIFLELKRVGGRLSPHQEQFLGALQAEGYATIVAYGADEAIAELIKVGY